MKHLISIKDLTKKGILDLISNAIKIKKNPEKFQNTLYEKVLLTFFQSPSLRTELSFDTAMFQMGGEVIDFHSETSPWAKGKESIEDVARVVSRYCDIVMIRMYDHKEFLKFVKNSSIPIINGMTNFSHPCQILGDLMTIYEKKKRLTNLKLVYFGDANNNVTHSLLYGCAKVGVNITVACPNKKEFSPLPIVLKEAKKFAIKSKSKIDVTNKTEDAAKNADIIYTDSWMSYHVPKSQYKKRIKILKPYQINKKIMSNAKSNSMFMHCLPAKRGYEVTNDVIDGKHSIVFDQAENRLHIQKAILLKLLKKI